MFFFFWNIESFSIPLKEFRFAILERYKCGHKIAAIPEENPFHLRFTCTLSRISPARVQRRWLPLHSSYHPRVHQGFTNVSRGGCCLNLKLFYLLWRRAKELQIEFWYDNIFCFYLLRRKLFSNNSPKRTEVFLYIQVLS